MDIHALLTLITFRACKIHRRKLDVEERCTACDKKVSESASCRDFNVQMYVEAESGVCTVKACASHFDDAINTATDLEARFEELVGVSLQIDCEGEIEAEEPKVDAVRIMIG